MILSNVNNEPLRPFEPMVLDCLGEISAAILKSPVGRQFPEGFFTVMAAVAVFFWYRYIAQKHFEGINGDLAGWFLCKCEVWMLVAVAVAASLS